MLGWNKRLFRGSTSSTPTSLALPSITRRRNAEGDPKSCAGEAAHNFYYYRVPVSRLGMDDHPDLSPPRANCPLGLSEIYIGDNSLDDDRSNPEQPNLGTNYYPGLGLVANNPSISMISNSADLSSTEYPSSSSFSHAAP
jgi:hypothetical protein